MPPVTPEISTVPSNNGGSVLTTFEILSELFEREFPCLLDDIFVLNRGDTEGKFDKELTAATDYIQRCMSYNVPHGKKLRGKMVAMVFNALVHNATEEQQRLARILGWILETLQAAYLVADDIMDKGETRRGRKCWYLEVDNVASAYNDSFLLEHLAYQLLRKYFGELECYTDLLNLLLNVGYKTVVGQGMDIRASTERNYNEELYDALVTYKTGYYTIYLPMALGMVFAGIPNNEANKTLWKEVKGITLEIGRMFQAQDDYLDCFGDKKVVGKKIGKDIEEGKCTWLYVKAQQLCSQELLKRLRDNYGKTDPQKVAAVIDLYEILGLRKEFAKYQETIYADILRRVKGMTNESLGTVLIALAKMLYSRAH